MNRSAKTLALSISLISGLASTQSLLAAETLLGFDAAGSAAQRALEADFDSRIDAREMEAWLRDLSFEPHHVGSPKGYVQQRLGRMQENAMRSLQDRQERQGPDCSMMTGDIGILEYAEACQGHTQS